MNNKPVLPCVRGRSIITELFQVDQTSKTNQNKKKIQIFVTMQNHWCMCLSVCLSLDELWTLLCSSRRCLNDWIVRWKEATYLTGVVFQFSLVFFYLWFLYFLFYSGSVELSTENNKKKDRRITIAWRAYSRGHVVPLSTFSLLSFIFIGFDSIFLGRMKYYVFTWQDLWATFFFFFFFSFRFNSPSFIMLFCTVKDNAIMKLTFIVLSFIVSDGFEL